MGRPKLDITDEERKARHRACCALYRENNKEKIAEIDRTYYKNNKEKVAATQKRYRPRNSIRIKKYIANLRAQIFSLLGDKCCQCKYNTDSRAFQIDHIFGGGNKERKSFDHTIPYLKHVLKSVLNDEKRYQLLCANCNWIKRYEDNRGENPCQSEESVSSSQVIDTQPFLW